MINKQVDEMANDYYEAMLKARGTLGSMNDGAPKWYAKELYNKGWRKESDVARDIFERLHAHIKYDGHTLSVWKNDLICIAKEFGVDLMKYESEGADDDQT